MKILITGANSMVGKSTIKALEKRNIEYIPVLHSQYDLRKDYEVRSLFEKTRPTNVIHLATYSGNIGFNMKYPIDTFYNTSMIGLNVLKFSKEFNIDKVTCILSSCSYPDMDVELKEELLWSGLPNKTIDCHGFAKRLLDGFGRQLRKEGVKYISCIANNIIGPYDSLDLNKTKVGMALIKKFVDARNAKDASVTCFGDGSPLREFIYSDDVGEALLEATINYEGEEPINITSGQEISIKDLATTIAKLVGYDGEIIWDTSKPNGQMRKRLSKEKMDQFLKVEITPIEEALKRTIEWYIKSI